MTARRMFGAITAQILAQALTGWSLLMHVAGWPDVSVWVVTFLIAAVAVPFRHNGSLKDRAAGNFGAGLVLSGFFWWELIDHGLDSIVGGGGFELPVQGLLLLTATVLFSVAGAVFWMMREGGDE